MKICRALLTSAADLHAVDMSDAMHLVAREARTIEQRLSKSDWIVGDSYSAVDMVIFPAIQLLRRALGKTGWCRNSPGVSCRSRRTIPRSGRWLARIEALPGYDRTYPPHWRE